LSEGLADGVELDRIDVEAGAEMDAALAFAVAAPPPRAGSMFEDVYAPGTIQPRPQRDRLRAILGEAA
jgi:TPP-dependent pyruvate/acetoin dehydrogenase alpha subunit